MKVIIEARNTPNIWRLPGTTATLEIYADQSFETADGQSVFAGNYFEQNFFLSKPLTIDADSVLLIPDVQIDSTTDAFVPSQRNSTYTAVIRSITGDVFVYLAQFPVPATAGTTWATLNLYKNSRVLRQDVFTLGREEIVQLVEESAGTLLNASDTQKGIAYADVAPDDPSAPVFVGINSPLVQATSGTAKDSDYDSLSTAVISIGSTPTVLNISTVNWPVGVSCTVPTTLMLQFIGDGRLEATDVEAIILSSGDLWPGRRIFVQSGTGHITLGSPGENPATPIRPLTNEINPVWWSAGSGTHDDPYTGWEGIFTAFSRFRFPPGYFQTPNKVDWNRMCLEVQGAGKSTTIIKYTGTETYAIDNRATGGDILYGQDIGGFSLHGNALATHGIVHDLVASSKYHDYQVQDFPGVKHVVGFALVSVFENIFPSPATTIHPETVPAQYGFAWGWDAIGHNMTSSVVSCCWAENCTIAGMRLDTVLDCTFIGGTSENNGTGIGLQINPGVQMCTFISMDLEGNPGGDMVIQGGASTKDNTFIDMLSVGAVNHINGVNNRFIGGTYGDFTVGAASLASLDAISCTTLTDNSVNTVYPSGYVVIAGTAVAKPIRGSAIEFGFGTFSKIIPCVGTPEGAVTAEKGSLALRSDGGAGTTLYVKESGSGNTGWIPK